MNVGKCVCIYVSTWPTYSMLLVCMLASMYVIYEFICMLVSMCIGTYVCLNVLVGMRVNIYVNMYVGVCVYVYVCLLV